MAGLVHKLKDLSEVRKIENIDEKVSKKYVPIYTSEVIEHLSPEFEFNYAVKYYSFNSAHSAYLDFNGATISIENSYDRSRAFSFKYNDGAITIPLDLNRQLHIGEKAKVVVNDISINKDAIIKGIENAKTVVEKLKFAKATDEFKDAIKNIIFKQAIEKDNFVELIDADVASTYKSVYTYVNATIKKYEEGNYRIKQVSKKDGQMELRHGRKSSSAFLKLQITNAIYEYVAENFPEAFI